MRFNLETKLVLIFINDVPDVISSELVIYIDGTTIYSCLTSALDMSNEVKLAFAFENNLQSVV